MTIMGVERKEGGKELGRPRAQGWDEAGMEEVERGRKGKEDGRRGKEEGGRRKDVLL
jgi:hypothetical protein